MALFQATTFNLVCVYRSQFPSKITDIFFLRALQKLFKNSNRAYILGDFNSEAFEENSMTHQVKKLGFLQLIHQPTHILGGLIDHCYVSKNIEEGSYKISQNLYISLIMTLLKSVLIRRRFTR